MALSSLQKSLLTSFSVGSVLFGFSTVPLAMLRTLPVEVEVSEQVVFEDEVDALSGPYLGVTGALTAALCFGILGVSGWRSAAKNAESEQEKSSQLETHLLACKAELERLRFSDARLSAEHLEEFLEPHGKPALAGVSNRNGFDSQPSLPTHRNEASIEYPQVRMSDGSHQSTHVVTKEETIVAQDRTALQSSLLPMKSPRVAQNASVPFSHPAGQKPEHEIQSVLNQLKDLVAHVESMRDDEALAL